MEEEVPGTRFHGTRLRSAWLIILGAGLLAGFLYVLLCTPPRDFPAGQLITIEKGEPAREVAEAFASLSLVKHPTLFRIVMRIFGTDSGIQAGVYRFEKPLDLFRLARRLGTGATGVSALRITFPEGETIREMAARVEEALPTVSKAGFIAAAGTYEGYLFPDTYFFTPGTDALSMVNIMRANFDTRTASITPDITRKGHTLAEIVTMASLIEKETNTRDSRRLVAGILWNRISIGMPLQVDAVFGYIRGIKTYSPTFDDLELDSPYNTYRNKGLPPGPIGNPGLDSILAALDPTKTAYLYYLTGADGNMYYAKTFEEHKLNRARYLK